MGEARRRSLSKVEILASAHRCVYCPCEEVTTVEHMPPRGLFQGSDRPGGWEFACCERCNQGTRGADAVAQFMSKLEVITEEDWKFKDVLKLRSVIRKHAPEVLEELFDQSDWKDALVRRNGLLFPTKAARVDGPETKKNLDLFSAKIAMATFRTFTGRPLDMCGVIYTQWFLNAGMSPEIYQNVVSIMPGYEQLKQGKKISGKQFSLRYNTNEKNIVAALLSFHNSMHITVIATDSIEFTGHIFDACSRIHREPRPGFNLTRPGLPQLDEKPES